MKPHYSYLCFDLSSVGATQKEVSERRSILCSRFQCPLFGEEQKEFFRKEGSFKAEESMTPK